MRHEAETLEGWQGWRAARLYGLTALIAMTGVRAMEGQCLWVSDLDLEGRGDLSGAARALAAAGLAPGDAPRFKTEQSAQPIAMPAALVPILGRWLERHHEHPDGWPMPPLEVIPWVFPGSRRICAWVAGPADQKPAGRLRAVRAEPASRG